MNTKSFLFIIALIVKIYCEPRVYFFEQFEDGDRWQERWVHSEYKGKEMGQFILSHGKFYGDHDKSKGIQTSEDNRFYGLSAKFEPFSNQDKNLVIQFTVKHEQDIDCGGGYLKLFDCSLDRKELHGDDPYLIMFGPDICGPTTKKVHIIFNYKGKNLLIEKDIRCKDDVYTHLYTLIVKPDNTYIVKVDNEEVAKGELEKDWNFLPPKTIKDPNASKPAEWDERPTVDDPSDKKPDDWDKPEYIPDPEATKPEDWDDEMDGEWEPPMINNPEYQGDWKPRQIDNPQYKGPWIHPEVVNPDYVADPYLYRYDEICVVGFDLWQVKSGTIFDNILITDDIEYAELIGKEAWENLKEAEYKMKKELDNEESEKYSRNESEDDGEESDEEEMEDQLPVSKDKHEHEEL